MPDLERLRADHAEAVLAFESANRDYLAWYTFLFDTLEDGAPGGEYVSDWHVDARGPQEIEDICALAVELTS